MLPVPAAPSNGFVATHRSDPVIADCKTSLAARAHGPNQRHRAMHDITRVLVAIDRGEPLAASELLPLVYDELRKLAAQKLAQEKPGQTLDPTALVHEAYLRLVEGGMGLPCAQTSPSGRIVDISLVLPPRPCGVSSSRMPAAKGVKSTAAVGGASTPTLMP